MDYTDPIHGGQIVPTFNIPEVFGNALSYEDKLIALAKWCINAIKPFATKDELEKLRSTLTDLINQTGTDGKAYTDKMVGLLREQVEKLSKGVFDYDVQRGEWVSSDIAMRDMFNDITVHGITVAELNSLDGLTVKGLTDCGLNVRGLAVIGRWLIDQTGSSDATTGNPGMVPGVPPTDRVTVENLAKAHIDPDGYFYQER